MKYSTVSELKAKAIKLTNPLSISLSLEEVVRYLECSTEEIVRDGLGPFEIVVLFSEKIGFWALTGSEAYPQDGATVWALPNIGTIELALEVRLALGPLNFQLMNSSTGEMLEGT